MRLHLRVSGRVPLPAACLRALAHHTFVRSAALAAVCLALSAAPASAVVERIAYESSNNIATADANGANQLFLVASAHNPALSPNGQQVAFDKGGTGIGIADMRGTSRMLLDASNEPASAFSFYPQWSPDGTKLVFNRSLPDGKQSDIYTINANGSGLTRLVSWSGNQEFPTFSPDGTKITFSSDATNTGTALKTRTLYTVSAATGGSPVKLLAGIQPSYSPDGTKIAFASSQNIYTMTSAGASRTALTSDAQSTSPSWSPDGTKIVYTHGVPSGGGITYTVNQMTATGGSQTPLISGGYVGEASYRQPGGGNTVYDYVAGELRPVLMFDNSESWRPLNVDRFFGENQHRVCVNGGCVPVSSAQALLTYPDPASYLDIAGSGSETNYVNPTLGTDCPQSAVLRDCDTGARSAIYYHVSNPSPGGYRYLDYWFFYRFNYFGSTWPADELGNHEGDWEGVSLAASQSATNTFDYASFSQHGTWYSYVRGSLTCDGGGGAGTCGTQTAKQGSRVNVYVTNGDHANYGTPCSEVTYGDCWQQNGTTPERGHDGAKPWGRNNDDSTSTVLKFGPLGINGWIDWAGRWGNPNDQPNNGPASPGSQQPHYNSPWTSTCYWNQCDHERRFARPRLLRPSAAATPKASSQSCANWFAAEVVALACQPKRLASAVRRANIGERSRLSLRLSRQRVRLGRATGVTQAVGRPLRPGDRIAVLHARPGTRLYVRVVDGRRSHQAVFIYRGRVGGTWRMVIERNRRREALFGVGASHRRILPTEQASARRRKH